MYGREFRERWKAAVATENKQEKLSMIFIKIHFLRLIEN